MRVGRPPERSRASAVGAAKRTLDSEDGRASIDAEGKGSSVPTHYKPGIPTFLDPATGKLTNDHLAGFLFQGKEESVLFKVRVKNPETGLQITNKATIVFDINPPMDTPVWVNAIDIASPGSRVTLLTSTQQSSSVLVTWNGSDAGSGIAAYNILMSDDGGAFTLWLTETASTQGLFNGAPGHTYRFYSLARDSAGNIEAGKTTAEATTTDAQQPSCAMNATPQCSITRSGFRLDNATRPYMQTVRIIKSANSQQLAGPFALALEGLSTNATVYGAAGATSCSLPMGSLIVSLAPGVTWASGQSVTFNVEFVNPTNAGITYSPRILAGNGN